MGRNFFKLVFPLFFITTTSLCQTEDSLIVAQGKILNAATKEPVMARITYQSLPYGSKVGVVNNNMYSFPMFGNEKYSIIVEAPGYSVVKYMIDPAEAKDGKNLIKDIELTTGNAAPPTDTEVGKVIRLDNLIFQVGKARLSPDSNSELEAVLNMMQQNKKMVIQLEGHTDFQGDAKENLRLSQMRVDAVKKYLVEKQIPKARIKTKAFGGSQPLSRENTPDAHRLNRRVELRILEN